MLSKIEQRGNNGGGHEGVDQIKEAEKYDHQAGRFKEHSGVP